MARMVTHSELLHDDMLQEGGSPDAGGEPIGNGAALHNVEDVFPLGGGQPGGPPAALTFFESLQLRTVPGANPIIDTGALDTQKTGDFRRRMALDTQADGLQAQDDAGNLVGFRLLLPVQEVLAGALIATGENRLHNWLCCLTYARAD